MFNPQTLSDEDFPYASVLHELHFLALLTIYTTQFAHLILDALGIKTSTSYSAINNLHTQRTNIMSLSIQWDTTAQCIT